MTWPFRRRRNTDDADAELRAEIDFHLKEEARLRVDRGDAPEDARLAARRAFGNVALVTEATRRAWGWRPAMLTDDLRHAYRRLRSRPAIGLGAAAMLALGIGLTTGMFTVIDALVLRPAPFQDPDRLLNIELLTNHTGRTVVPAAVFDAWRRSPVFSAVEGTTTEVSIVDTATGPAVRASAHVSPGIFDMLGVRPSRGRVFDPGDGRTGTDDRVLLSEDLWRSAFGGDPAIIGSRITVDGASA